MRKYRKKLPEYRDIRVVTFFAWLPVFTNREWRWLEKVRVKQEANCLAEWKHVEFVDIGEQSNLLRPSSKN